MSTHGPELALIAPGLPLKFSGGRGLLGAMAMLRGEASGMASDFTAGGGLGQVAVKGHTTNLNNAPVDDFWVQSGTSPKRVLGADGLYHWSPHNLAPYSEALDNAFWGGFAGDLPVMTSVVGPAGTTITAGRFTWDGVGNEYRLAASSTGIISDALYTLSFWHKSADGANHTFATSDQFLTTVGATSVWQKKTITAVLGGGSVYLGFDFRPGAGADATGDVYIWGVHLNRGPVPTAYHVTTAPPWFGVPIEYSGGGYYALVEPQATNILLHSQDYDDAGWTKHGATITANATVAPDGTMTADKIVEDNQNFYHRADANGSIIAVTASQFYTHSFFAKAAERSVALINTTNVGVIDEYASFDLTGNGAVLTQAPQHVRAAITPVGNGWFRCEVTLQAAVGQTQMGHYVGPLVVNPLYQGVPGSGLYLWGSQVELGSVATSPIPTFAATVTRAGDDPNVATSAFAYAMAGAGSAIFEGADRVAGTTYYVDFNDTAAEQLVIYKYSDNNNYAIAVDAGNPTGIGSNVGPWVADQVFKSAAAWSPGVDFANVKDGGAVAVAGAGTMPSPAILRLGSSPAFPLLGRIRRFTYVPRRMTNAELQAKTA